MKYGMRERISGAVILLALAVIFIPMLFDEPPERDERPEPVLTIEQPIDIDRQPVEEPEPPASLSDSQQPQALPPEAQLPMTEAPAPQSQNEQPTQAEAPPEPGPEPTQQNAGAEPEPEPEAQPEQAEKVDPIAELTSQAEPPSAMPPVAENGEWAVQVGSFGEPGNAERLEAQLDDQGFTAYRRPRDNDLTTVYVGPFGSSEAGEQARTVLKEKVNIQGLLIRIQEGE
ncbi:DedD protein [Modicisalibacter muralis]|uniref:DedD protein n=1 Tax=Modicisalibacter muralis TaxID=119000 RepID=A0A1G9N4T8_9GAMM|nr:SPOR domain-containing protein [Halomonas muralis]SDL81311.1 DedD protein [Halomonas muralis]